MVEEYKGYVIERAQGSLCRIRRNGKGMVPMTMRGLFTSVMLARQAIDVHLEKMESEGKDAKGKETPRDEQLCEGADN